MRSCIIEFKWLVAAETPSAIRWLPDGGLSPVCLVESRWQLFSLDRQWMTVSSHLMFILLFFVSSSSLLNLNPGMDSRLYFHLMVQRTVIPGNHYKCSISPLYFLWVVGWASQTEAWLYIMDNLPCCFSFLVVFSLSLQGWRKQRCPAVHRAHKTACVCLSVRLLILNNGAF